MKTLFETKTNDKGVNYYILVNDRTKTYIRGSKFNPRHLYDVKFEVKRSGLNEIEKELIKNEYVREEKK